MVWIHKNYKPIAILAIAMSILAIAVATMTTDQDVNSNTLAIEARPAIFMAFLAIFARKAKKHLLSQFYGGSKFIFHISHTRADLAHDSM